MSSNRDTIKLQKHSKLPAIWQTYQKLYYREKLKTVVDTAYEEFLKSNKGKEAKDASTLRRVRIRIQNKIAREKYEAESEEVKAEVEKDREDMRNGENREPEKLQK